MKFTIRRARFADLQILLDLFQAFRPVESPPKKANEKVKIYFKKILRDKNNIIFVAEHDGKLIGSIQLTIINAIIVGLRPWGAVSNTVVVSAYQRHGVGTKLIAAIEGEALKHNCYRITISSRFDWKAGHKFYEKHGYKFAAKDFRKYFRSRTVTGDHPTLTSPLKGGES